MPEQRDDGFELPADDVAAALGRGVARALGLRVLPVSEVAPEHCPVCIEAIRAKFEAELFGGAWEPCPVHAQKTL